MDQHKKYFIEVYRRAKKQGPKALIPVLTFVLLFLVSQSAARLSWQLLDFRVQPQADLANLPNPSSQTVLSEPAPFSSELTDLHFFGRAGRVMVAPLADASSLPSTTLQLVLVGVIYSTSPEKSVAIIRQKNNTVDADLYGVGDRLSTNAVLSEIQPDRVILRRAGHYETLTVEESTPSSVKVRAVKKGRSPKRGLRKKDRRDPIRPRGDGANWSIDRTYLNERLANLDELASEIGVDVYQVDGEQQGYRFQLRSGELLGQLGLQAGDVLTEVNGMPLRSGSDAMQAYAKTKNAEKVRVQIIRDGKLQTREYSIGQL